MFFHEIIKEFVFIKGAKIKEFLVALCDGREDPVVTYVKRLEVKCTSMHFFALLCTPLHSHALPVGSAFYPCTPNWECIIFFGFMHSQNQFLKIFLSLFFGSGSA